MIAALSVATRPLSSHSTFLRGPSTIDRVPDRDLQQLCDDGQRALVQTHYIDAERILMRAESRAWLAHDWDTLARLYMPLQEARRQRRQRCGEGVVKLDLLTDPGNGMAARIADRYPHGQLLVAAPGSIEPAVSLRRIAWERGLYLETFLGASYRVNDALVLVIVPTADVTLPPDDGRPFDRLLAALPPFSIVLSGDQMIPGERRGDDATYAQSMSLWEQLHAPFLAAAHTSCDKLQQMNGLRRTIEVDYACEFAHQDLSKIAASLKRVAAVAPTC